MPAYIIADVNVTNPAAYENYKTLTPNAVAKNGGRFIARGGQAEALEGGWQPNRVVILEFPDYATAKAFYDSPEYREAREARKDAADFRMIVVDGA
ncbi:DUF1330 domain-containing protein [Azospirillum brasilense]|uniref:DUF1330 domain-containing protein n=1 Tax=Azospirillum brasilense TaxID=192 RepID=A0A0P0E9B8_AZOBR|nr:MULTISPECIES: DUF1330 domain-containing protein [Azospirillum]ALJ34898.1 hypothetical protein AMK58_05390 [Azospirillum brasilense]MDW7553380.1 DUF1330 domain-containing protein [Azospirillum brasilense]MDW7594414.1 DUF1330 domain-containing protein [Azospirillum brasilense]MDW7629286.1 DUF1330 domain-containing protein [Azospirillum brasilense]MDX5953571.1 DUF1330 domain-containing protein [Azospirillum brasilense]